MEQVFTTPAVADGSDGVAALEESSLAAMLARARDLDASERAPFVTRVTVRLRSLGKAPADERKAASDAVLALLDQSAFDGLEDGSGRPAHSAAVEALLTLGYPYALGLRPEDLVRYREAGASSELLRTGWRLPAALVLIGVGMQTGGYLKASGGDVGRAVGQLGLMGLSGLVAYLLMAAGAAGSFLAPQRGRWHRWSRRLLLFGGVVFGAVLATTVAQLPGDAWWSTLKSLGWDVGLVVAAAAGAVWPRTKPAPPGSGS